MRRLLLLFCLFFLISTPDALAYTHSWTTIVSENRSTTGWNVYTSIGLNGILGDPQSAAGANSGSLEAFTSMQPFMAWTPPHAPDYYSENLSGQPSDYNGFIFAWDWYDANGSYRQTAVAAGIRRVEMSYNFHVVSGGDHPTIGWSNDDTNATQYRIRVLNPATSALYYEVDLNRVELGSNPVYTFSEFNFMPGVTYDLRIETRQYVDSNIYSNPAGSYIRPQVLNRSTYFASYTNTDSSAYAHSWTLIVSDNRTTGWRLFTDIGINGVLGTPQGAYGSTSETLGAFKPMQPWAVWTPPNTPEFYSQDLSGQPSDHNGFTFAWEWSDSRGSYRQTAVATGIRRVQVSYDFHVVADGAHPTIGWSNDDTNVTQYRIRVLNPSSDALLYEANLDYAQFGAHPVYKIGGFSFNPGVDYLLRIEARQEVQLGTYSTPDGTKPYVLNRSVLLVPFTAAGPISSKIGTFRPGSGMWYLDTNGNHAWNVCGTDGCYSFGMIGDIPVAGDWNNDGVAEVGVFRPNTGMWYLDQNGNDQWSGCGTDSCIHFGMSGDLPVAGDWNNSGPAKVGVFRPSTGMWYLESNGNGRWDGCETDSCFHFGVTGDLPIAGDWNGDGKSKVGVFRPSTGMWYLDSNGNGQWDGCGTDSCIRFGMSGDQPVAGDWNGSSTAKVGVFRPSTGWWYVDLNGNGAWDGCSVDGCYYFGTTGDVAIAGSWTNESGILTNEELGYLTPAERSEISLLNGSALIDKGLQNLTNQEVLKAKDYFKVAVGKYDGDSTNTAQKAWFFRALTRVSALAFDTAADGVEDGLQDIGDILDRAGYSSDPAKRNPFNYQALTLPTTVATNSPRGIEIQQFAYTMILPELMGAIDDLDHVLESFNVRWVEPLDGTSVESDYGDVLAFRTALKAAIAIIYIQYAYNLDADTAIEYNDYMSSWFTAEAFLASNLNFGNLAAVNHLPSSREYLDGAATDALSAINWIQAETDDQSDDYVNLTNATPEEIIDTKNKIIAFQKSLYGSATINNEGTPDDTIINLTPAFTGLNLRSFLPQFVDNVPLGDLPDETFGRVLEKISGRPPTRLNEDWDGNATADILDLIPRKFHARDSWPLGVYVTWDKIKWGMLEVAIEYNVYWSTSPGVTQSSNRISTTKNWLLHSNLTPGAYYYRIAAVTAAGEGPLSEEAGVYVGQ